MALLVGLVTPADDQSPTYKAFDHELGYWFGWPKGTLQCYPASKYGGIQGAAHAAYTDVNSNGGVLVAAGEMAAFYLQEETKPPNNDQIPIILAYGGEAPPNRAKNMTGFVGSCVAVGQHHLNKLTGHKVTVLYDPDKSNQATIDVLNALKNVSALAMATDQVGGLTSQYLDVFNNQHKNDAFMLIPNAVYYKNSGVIADAVDGSSTVKIAYYPEIEFWRQHKNRKSIAKVYGHNVPLTYRLAASWVDNLLRGYWTVDTMPNNFADAIIENYE
jgi:hypothetical protein